MNTATGTRRGVGPGRLDPTVRALLRAFLSPAVADRYASALQPIAVADRDAALAGAVSTLRTRFFVLPEELAVALVEDAGWSVADVSTMLGLPTLQVRAALREAAGDPTPRIGATPPADLGASEGALVDELLADLPAHRRDAASAAEEPAADDPVDIELATAIPAHVGRPTLEARIQRSDRIQRAVVNLTIVGILGLTAMALAATRPAQDVAPLPEDSVVDAIPSPAPDPSPTPSAQPSPEVTPAAGLPVGPPVIAEARFVAGVDPTTGNPGPTLELAEAGDDPRLWLRLSQVPADNTLLTMTFTAPSGRSTVRPVLLTDRTPLVSVRLPDELGRAPGRYGVRIEADQAQALVLELQILPAES